MQAVVFKDTLQVAVERRLIPTIQQSTDVIVKVRYTALCGRQVISLPWIHCNDDETKQNRHLLIYVSANFMCFAATSLRQRGLSWAMNLQARYPK